MMAIDLSRMSVDDVVRLAHAAAWDEINRAMRARGGKTWDEGDINAGTRAFDRLMAAAGMPGYGGNK